MPTALLAPPTHTDRSVLADAASTPAFDDVDAWTQAWVRPVTEFGLTINQDPPHTPYDTWSELLANDVPVLVPVALIRSSTQADGVRLDALAHYLVNPNGKLFDRDGWFGNLHPVLIARDDGTYTIRDGNHRVIAAALTGSAMILAHVMR